jgi:AraC-like DNA-binding protein
MTIKRFKEFTYKKFGVFQFDNASLDSIHEPALLEFIKIVFLKKGGSIQVDFKTFNLKSDALFFINPQQPYNVSKGSAGAMICYNRDFYCVEIHDREVACDGILYNNVYDLQMIFLSAEMSKTMESIFKEINSEIETEDRTQEEMLRILLKGLIIRSTRIWKMSHQVSESTGDEDIEFVRKFSRFVEANFRTLHGVSDYAELLHITPKALNKRVHHYGKATPNEIIKNRIILEAKRLLLYTDHSVKEIAYQLGYEDPAYFNRLFTRTAGLSPIDFKKQYHKTDGKKVQFE